MGDVKEMFVQAGAHTTLCVAPPLTTEDNNISFSVKQNQDPRTRPTMQKENKLKLLIRIKA